MAQEKPGELLGGFSEAQAAQLTHVSVRQLRHWSRTGFFKPAINPEVNGALPLSLYVFRDLVSLKVIGLLRNRHKISLRELRHAKDRLSHLGPDVWAKTIIYVLGRKVVFEDPRSGKREEATTGQGVFETIPLKLVTGELETDARRIRQRDVTLSGRIERKNGVLNHRPVIAGTRILVDTILSFSEDGYSPAEIIRQFPILTEDDIASALRFKETA